MSKWITPSRALYLISISLHLSLVLGSHMVPSAWICGTTEQSSFLISFIHLQPFWSACSLTCQHDVSDSFLADFFPYPVTLHSCYLIPIYLLPPLFSTSSYDLRLLVHTVYLLLLNTMPQGWLVCALLFITVATRERETYDFQPHVAPWFYSKLYLWYDRSDFSIQKQGSEVPGCHRDWSFSRIAARMNLLFATQEP
jgi:hypothetical protein